MKPYKLVVVFEAVGFIQQQNRFGQKIIEQALLELRESPHNRQNLTESGASGREHFVCFYGAFAIKFWIDEWEREVKVIDIMLRDRRK